VYPLETARAPDGRQHSPGQKAVNKNQVKGHIKEAKGKGKELAGKAVGNKQLQREGKVENLGGKAEVAYGDLKKEVQRNTK
jgi:uncharacterized protein YjbJ (UPF0337 family)